MVRVAKEKKQWVLLAAKVGVAVMTFVIGVGAYWVSTFKRLPMSTPQQAPTPLDYTSAEPGTLKARILEAKATGEGMVELSSLACGWDIGRLQDALSRDTVVLAELVGKKTYADTWGLHTWYRFRIKETLLDHAPPRYDYLYASGPDDMLPIADDEFLIDETNGRMEIDGVTVIQHSNGAGI